ncbi:MAG TPA: hypothetical protein VNZ57_06625 [Longimicrobiales bacterium]|nr:hypothetical protein [Longimicrobiales bacterium]
MAEDERLIYHAGKQIRKVRFVQVITLLTAAAGIWGGIDAFRHYGLHPTEGGVLAPIHVRLLLGGSLFALGVACIPGIWIFGRCYVRSIVAARYPRRLRFEVAGMLRSGRIEVEVADIVDSEYRPGAFDGGKMPVNAPWMRIRVRNRKVPLIVDLQGEIRDPRAFESLIREWVGGR